MFAPVFDSRESGQIHGKGLLQAFPLQKRLLMTKTTKMICGFLLSHPARGGWIEISEPASLPTGERAVPPRTGWVD